MTISIPVHDDLARCLQREADSRRLSVEDLALTILADAVLPTSSDEDWGVRNKRRLELIRKSTQCELADEEQAELDRLQSWLDERFESFDAGLLKQLDEMKEAVAQLSSEESRE